MTSKKKKQGRGLIVFFSLILLILGLIIVGALFLNAPVDKNAGESIFLIRSGESVSSASYHLQEQGYVKSYYSILILYKIMNPSSGMRVGSYRISPSWTSWKIYETLIKGRQDLVSVTVPEGFTMKEIAILLDEKDVTDESLFLQSAMDKTLLEAYDIPAENFEGYLFPDTYLFPRQYDAPYVLNIFIENFYKKMDRVYPDWKELTAEQLHQKVIMASIVEREYRSSNEAPLIASVFYNRLVHWYPRLESCATVTYIITDLMGKPHPDHLTTADIEMDHPYNTYENSGLPPGPISNPGAIALDAAFNPARTDYLYFVVKNQEEGTHNFSSNYSDFQVYKYQYLRNYRSK